MQHLATYPMNGGLRCTWLPAPDFTDRNSTRILELDFRRIVIGVNYEPRPMFAVVVAEREITKKSRLFVVLEDVEAPLPQQLFTALVSLKDRYRANLVIAPKGGMAESLRAEGLTHYAEDYPQAAGRRLWPTYQGSDLVAGLFLQDTPDKSRVDRDLEARLAALVTDPDTGLPLKVEGREIPELYLPADFPNKSTRAGLRRSQPGPCTALWFATQHLSRSYRPPAQTPAFQRQGNPLTGY